jgi:hypothetical protein
VKCGVALLLAMAPEIRQWRRLQSLNANHLLYSMADVSRPAEIVDAHTTCWTIERRQVASQFPPPFGKCRLQSSSSSKYRSAASSSVPDSNQVRRALERTRGILVNSSRVISTKRRRPQMLHGLMLQPQQSIYKQCRVAQAHGLRHISRAVSTAQ